MCRTLPLRAKNARGVIASARPAAPDRCVRARIQITLALLIASISLSGCDKPPSPASAPAAPQTAPASAPAVTSAPSSIRSPILPESADWPKETAISKLLAEKSTDPERISAAVRLARIAATEAALLPEPLADRDAARLAVRDLGDAGWALGRASLETDRLASPILISNTGDVTVPVDGAEEEVSQLIASDDAERFPHILLTPRRILILGETIRPAIVAKDLNGARLECRLRESEPIIAIVYRPPEPATTSAPESQASPSEPVVVASYYWDRLELAFIGPASDELPGPAGGFFELDLPECKALVPVGGKLKPPETIPDDQKPPNPDVPPEF